MLPGVKEQLCRKHKVANVLDKLPKRLHGAAKGHLHEIMYAPDRDAADAKLTSFKAVCDAKYPWAVASLVDHADQLLTFLDFPAEHWVHVRTTNPIESTFGTVKARTKKPRCAGSHAAGLAAALKLMEAAEQRWRRLNAPPLVAAVLHGVHSKDGQRVATAPLSQTTARDPA